jgi:hypothetical protein
MATGQVKVLLGLFVSSSLMMSCGGSSQSSSSPPPPPPAACASAAYFHAGKAGWEVMAPIPFHEATAPVFPQQGREACRA